MTLLPPQTLPSLFVARDREVSRAVSALTSNVAVAIVGPAGVGRTSTAREVVARLDSRRTYVVWLAASEAGRQVPFGLVAALIPSSTPAEITAVLPHVRHTLRARAGNRRLVLVVDDAHLLDEASAAVVAGLADHAGLVVTVCSPARSTDAVHAWGRTGQVEHISLEPFAEGGTARLLASLVGGEPAAPTVDLVQQWTRGNALFLTEVVRAGLADGSLVEESGLWWWRGPLRFPPTLADCFDRRLDEVDAAGRDALTAVALGEPLALDLLERVVPSEAVVRLEDVGLLRAEKAGDWTSELIVRFDHPLLGAAVRRRLFPARRRRMATMLLEAQPQAPWGPAELVKRALWQVDAGGRIDGDLLLDAADLVLHADAALAARLAEVVARQAPSARASVACAAALVEQGEPGRARVVLERAAAEATDSSDATVVAVALAGHRAWAERDPAAGHRELTMVLDRVAEPAARADIGSLDALAQLFHGDARQALRTAEIVLADPAAGHRARLRSRLAQAAALSLIGRTGDALRVGEQAASDARADATGVPYAPGMAHAAVALATIWRSPAPQLPTSDPRSGRWPTISASFHSAADLSAWPLFDGYVRRVAGDLPGAVNRLREALVQQSAGEGLFRSEAAAWLILCLADAGRVAEAEDVFRSTPPDALAVVPGLLPWSSAGIAAARGARDEAIDLIREAITAARRSGCGLVELGYLLYEAGIRGADDAVAVAPRIRELIDHVDAPRLVVKAKAVLAVAEASPSLPEHVDSLERMGMARTALGVSNPGGSPQPTVSSLTSREAEVATLAGEGLTDREIADRLVLSVRTVESHLTRVYRKLDVNSRRRLTGILRQVDAGRPAGPGIGFQ